MAAAVGFGLIAGAALAVLFFKCRIARQFMKRDKAGERYTTQEEQVGRENAGIQLEDVIEI